MARLIGWIVLALVALWIFGIVFRIAIKLLIIGTIIYLCLAAFGLLSKRR